MERSRRNFIKTSAAGAVTVLAGGMLSSFSAKSYRRIMGANERVNVAVVGFHNRGIGHIRAYSQLENVSVAALCDIDQRLFAKAVTEIETLGGTKPELYTDYRKLLENKDIHAVSIVTPDHWHALQTIWACQAGKDVYIEKPLAYTVGEGRKMVEAARKYNRVVQTGTQSRSNIVVHKAMELIREGIIGDIYMGRAIVFGFRPNIGRVADSPVPKGVDWNMFLGPAPWHPFNENRFHYKWHWFWDTSTTEFGNNATHWVDLIRMAMQINIHPRKIQCTGGFYVWDSDQEIPNIQLGAFQYPDKRIIQIDVRSIYNNQEGGDLEGAFLYGSKGWMHLKHQNFRVFFGQKSEPGPSFSIKNVPALKDKGVIQEFKGLDIPHMQNFIDCVHSGRWQDLNADVLEGHLSSSIGLLGNMAYRLGRTLEFDSETEKFIGNEEADRYLKRDYRSPYQFPETV
ncbi:MAG: Gfo/Idh/MocA family oxidoreductase [Mangrovibacterium sp.]